MTYVRRREERRDEAICLHLCELRDCFASLATTLLSRNAIRSHSALLVAAFVIIIGSTISDPQNSGEETVLKQQLKTGNSVLCVNQSCYRIK